MKRALIVGSGIAGIAAAIRLSKQGYAVEVYEKNSWAGGKMREFSKNGFRYDAGPSLFTLPNLVEELFSLCGKRPENHFQYKRREVACRYFWDDGTQLTAHSDVRDFAREVNKVLDVPEKEILDYLEHAAFIYQTTFPIFVERSLHQWKNFFTSEVLKGLTRLHQLHLFSNLHRLNQNRFSHPKLVQLFDRFATYNGSSPFLTPAIMSMVPHLEHNIGTYYPIGGMYAIVDSLVKLGEEQGVKYLYNSEVERIVVENKYIKGIMVKDEFIPSELVVCNGDIVPAYRHLLKDQAAPEKILKQPRSSSALIFYWGMNREFPELDMHNIFFSNNYRQEFDHIFNQSTISDDATVYVHISSKQEKRDAPTGGENWFVMVNVPSHTSQNWRDLQQKVKRNIQQKLNKVLQIKLEEHIVMEEVLNPLMIEEQTSSYGGALYGAASNNRMAAFLRHPNFSPEIRGLYFCGGSVHPGGGIPLALCSAKITADIIQQHHAE